MALTVEAVQAALSRLPSPSNPSQRQALRTVRQAARAWIQLERPDPGVSAGDWVTLTRDRVGIIRRHWVTEWFVVWTDDGGATWTFEDLDLVEVVEVLPADPPEAALLPARYA